MLQPSPQTQLSYEQFSESWIEALRGACLEENGVLDEATYRRELVRKLLADSIHAEADLNDADFIWTATGAQNGIDAFYFEEVEPEDHDQDEAEGETALIARVVRYLLPLDLPATGRAVLQETAKVRHWLEGRFDNGSDRTLFQPLIDFWQQGDNRNSLELIFASINPLPAAEQEAVGGAEATLGAAAPLTPRGALSVRAKTVSLHSIFRETFEDRSVQVPLKVRVPDVEAGGSFVIGAVALLDLYDFLKEFRALRGDLDGLYERNVRLFLGRTGSVNKGISRTLREEPENFGLYNNGLTIVSREISAQGEGNFLLTDPSVVNGCQTTRTLWETLAERLRQPPETDAAKREEWQKWRNRVDAGRVVVKIVRVAPGESPGDDERLKNITEYTNSQNKVNPKDFIALDRDFKRWKRDLAMRGLFLEILRNEGAAQIARQKPRTYSGQRFEAIAKAFELFKVYGAGWMNEPGDAWNKNSAFLPKGRVFKDITAQDDFGANDFEAALYLQQAAEARKFGKRGKNVPESRRLSKFLFYRTALELVRRLLRFFNLPFAGSNCSRAILALHNSSSEWRVLADQGAAAIDQYLQSDSDYSVYQERAYSGDFNSFFKKTELAKNQRDYPNLWFIWNLHEGLLRNHAGFIARVEPVLRAAFQD